MPFEGETEEFTQDELVTLGELDPEDIEDEETAEDQDTDESVETEEEGELQETTKEEEEEASDEEAEAAAAEAETETDENVNMVPQPRVDQLRAQKGEVERKLELLKTNPDEYYRLYPDEKPASITKAESDTDDIDSLVMSGGKWDGMTLSEIAEENTFAATKIYNDYLNEQRELAATREAEKRRIEDESQKEIESFSQTIASELFEINELDSLTDEQGKRIEAEIAEVLTWMSKTGRGGGVLKDAYYLMNRDADLKKAASKGVKAIVNKLENTKAVKSVSGNKGGKTVSGFGKYESMSDEALANRVENMTDTEYDKFLKSAPKTFRDKHPEIPWDD